MTDAELARYWPDLGVVVGDLRGIGHATVADLLVAAVREGATSGEITGGVGMILVEHAKLLGLLSEKGAVSWGTVLAAYNRAYPTARLERWLARLARCVPPAGRRE